MGQIQFKGVVDYSVGIGALRHKRSPAFVEFKGLPLGNHGITKAKA